jgi:DNA polymerase-3 subunit alpha
LATETAIKHRPRGERELAEVLAIIRPGVVDAGLLTHYLDRRAGEEPVVFDHPMMAPIVGHTQGILVYQESILEATQQLAGFTPDEADDLRTALGKKYADQIEAMREKFLVGCLANPEFMKPFGDDDKAARQSVSRIWASINAAGRYAFNYSHGVGYAILATWEIWTKHYYPEEFIVALLATDPTNTNRYIREARRRGIAILPPCVNRSEVKFTIGDGGIRYGIDSVHGVGAAQSKDIFAGRPYASLGDYLLRAGKGSVKSSVLNLIKIGAFDSLGDRAQLLRDYQRIRASDDLAESTLNDPAKLDHRIATRLTENPLRWTIEVPDFSDPKVMLAIETELVGTHVTVDPLGPYLKMLEGIVINHPDELKNYQNGDPVRVGGLVSTIKLHTVAKGRTKGQQMAFLALDYNEEIFEVVAFPEMWAQVKHMLTEGTAVACQCLRTNRGVSLVHLELLDQLLEET